MDNEEATCIIRNSLYDVKLSTAPCGYFITCDRPCIVVLNPLDSKGSYSGTSNNTKLVHWPLMGGLLHLVQRGGAWVGCGPALSLPRCTKCNIPPINGQCTNHSIATRWSIALRFWCGVAIKGLNDAVPSQSEEAPDLHEVLLVRIKYSVCNVSGAVLRWDRGAQAPQMLASPPPPNILVPTAKRRILKGYFSTVAKSTLVSVSA